MDLMSYTCGDVTKAKEFNFVSPGQIRKKNGLDKELIGIDWKLLEYILELISPGQTKFLK